jgi:hypothetical protein
MHLSRRNPTLQVEPGEFEHAWGTSCPTCEVEGRVFAPVKGPLGPLRIKPKRSSSVICCSVLRARVSASESCAKTGTLPARAFHVYTESFCLPFGETIHEEGCEGRCGASRKPDAQRDDRFRHGANNGTTARREKATARKDTGDYSTAIYLHSNFNNIPSAADPSVRAGCRFENRQRPLVHRPRLHFPAAVSVQPGCPFGPP